MTIYLPEDLVLFRQSFDSACKRILESEIDATFYALFFQLIENLCLHPLLKEYTIELESSSAKITQEFNSAALEALEDNWTRLWKYHRHSLKKRKQLVIIKRMITRPSEILFTPLYYRIVLSLREFRCKFPFHRCVYEAPRLFRAAELELYSSDLSTHFYDADRKSAILKRISKYRLRKKDKRWNLQKKFLDSSCLSNAIHFTRPVHCISFALNPPKAQAVIRKFSIPGISLQEKRRNMQIMAETNPAFCWERVRFFHQCYAFNNNTPALTLTPTKGPWKVVREAAWQSALERSATEILSGAKMAFNQKLLPKPSSNIDVFIAHEHQIHRKDFEKYLQALQHHIHTQLVKIESTKQKNEPNPTLALPGTQKGDFVIDLASKYWKIHPHAKYDEVYENYCLHCPVSKILSRGRWEQIVRNRKLDHRSKEAKKRGQGKKT